MRLQWLFPLVLVLLSGCAAERAFRDGRQMLYEGRVEEGLRSVEAAMEQDPSRAEYRSFYLLQRERAVSQLALDGDAARLQGRVEAAQAAYKRALALAPGHPKAQAGLEAIAQDRRRAQTVQEVRELLKKGDHETAEARLRSVLAEDPKQRDATELLRKMQEKVYRDGQQTGIRTKVKTPVSLEFREAPIKLVLDALGRAGGINFVLDKDVKPDLKTTVSLKNVRMEDGLRLVMTSNQLEYKVLNENSILVYPSNPQKQREYRDLVVKTFFIANSDAKQVLTMLRAVLKTKDAYVDERLNLLVLRDTPEVMGVAERLIATQDLPESEVILELEVLEVSQSRLLDLGIQYPTRLATGIVVPNGGSNATPGVLTLRDFKNRSSDMVQLTITDPVLALNLSKTDGDTNLLANPRIRVKNREKAKVLIGERLPVITTTSTANVGVSESVSYLDVGLKLEVEPTVYLDDEVSIKVNLEVSSLLEVVSRASGLQTYRVGTRNATTTLRLRDGEPQVLAGLIQNSERDSASRIPGLGDLPVLGHLFSNQRTDHTKNEVVLLITPRIVRNLTRPDVADAEIPSGTEASVGGQSLHMPGTPEEAMPPPQPAEAPAANPSAQGSPIASGGASPVSPTAAPKTPPSTADELFKPASPAR